MKHPRLSHQSYGFVLALALLIPTLGFMQRPNPSPGAALLREFAGSDDTDAFLRHSQVRPRLQQLLGKELSHLEANLDVRGSVDVIGGALSIAGNAAHQGGIEEGVICISSYNLEMTAAIYSSGAVTAFSKVGTYDSLPLCIKDWITQMNSGHKDRFSQPTNVRMANVR